MAKIIVPHVQGNEFCRQILKALFSTSITKILNYLEYPRRTH